jgi:hypothetical protein
MVGSAWCSKVGKLMAVRKQEERKDLARKYTI